MDPSREAGVASPLVEAIRAFYIDERNGRVMADLFQENIGTISECSLEGLSQDWVQRLIKHVARLEERDRGGEDELHSLDRVSCQGCTCHVDRAVD